MSRRGRALQPPPGEGSVRFVFGELLGQVSQVGGQAELILAPRCSPTSSYERWKLVLRANAVTSCAFVVSTNRPGPEQGVPIGGASIAIAPDGTVLAESTDPLYVVTLAPDALRVAKEEYPGYLPVRSDLYARGWGRLTKG